MEFDTITIAIDKCKLRNSKFKNWNILRTAYTFLVERFDLFLTRKENKGMLRIDLTSNKPGSLNAKDCEILEHINTIRKKGTSWQVIKTLSKSQFFMILLHSLACRLRMLSAIARINI